MCGIVFSKTNSTELSTRFHKLASEIQKNRGPDYSGFFTHGDFYFSHQRLSIRNLSDSGNQPYIFNNIVMIYNGEIYNCEKLSDYLSSRYSFSSPSLFDTEILAAGIYFEGFDFIKKIDGMFSVIAYNSSTEQLIATSDPFGIKQLYYYWDGFSLFIASDLVALAGSLYKLGFEISRNITAIYQLYSFLGVAKPHSPFNEINSIYPGSALILTSPNSAIAIKAGFIDKTIDSSFSISSSISNSSQLASALDSLISPCSIGDVPSTLLLSGGLDSTLLARSLKGKISNSICISYPYRKDGFCDDSSYADTAASRYKIKHYEHQINNFSIESFQSFLDCVSNVGDLSGAYSLFESMKLVKYHGSKIVHSGLGADELFFGYRAHKLNLLHQFPYLIKMSSGILPFVLNSFSRYMPSSLNRRLNLIGSYSKAFFANPGTAMVNTLLRWDSEFPIQTEWDDKLFACDNAELGNMKDSDYLRKLTQFYYNHFLASSHFPITDSVSMAFSIELRVPFVTRSFYSYIFGCDSAYHHSRIGKSEIKNVLTQDFDKSFLCRSKTGFGFTPFDSSEFRSFLLDSVLPYLSWFSSNELIQLENLVLNANADRLLYCLLSILSLDSVYKKVYQ